MKGWWRWWRSLGFRARLGRAIALAVGLTVALASLAAYFTVRHQLLSQVNSSLISDANSSSEFLTRGGTLDTPQVVRFVRLSGGGYFQLITAQGQVLDSSFTLIEGSGPPPAPTAAQRAVVAADHGYRLDSVSYHGIPYRVITAATSYAAVNQFTGTQVPVAIQIGRPLTEVNHTLSTLGIILWLVVAGGMAAAVAIGFLLGRTMLRPVEKLTAAAEHVAATQDLSARIDEDGDDELARLARSFNSMLVALAASRQQQAQLISDAGHELRTPLTSLRTNIEVLMRVRDLPASDRADLVGDVEAQMEELTNLIGDLVDLARQEEKQPEPIEVRLDSIVEQAVERASRRAPNLHFDLHLTPGSVRASPALLERAILNVLDNAAKWSPPGATVEVWLQRGGLWALDIHDHGPGIAATDLPHVFDRFYRAETARSMPGSGLGLAIVHQVITDHGGTVTASVPPEGGTLVHIELPIVTEVEADGGDPGAPRYDGGGPTGTPLEPRPPEGFGRADDVAWSGTRPPR